MAKFTVYGEEVIDRVTTDDIDVFAVSVPDVWDSAHVKVIRVGDESNTMRIEGAEVIERTVTNSDDGVRVAVPSSWESETVKILRTGESMAFLTSHSPVSEDVIESTEIGDDFDVVSGSSKSELERTVSHAIMSVSDKNESGSAPVSDVVSRVVSNGYSKDECKDAIETLKRNGEVYQAKADRLRVV